MATLTVRGIGFDLGPASDVDTRTHKRWATSYHRLIDDYRWALRAGIIDEGHVYRFDPSPLTPIAKVVLQTAYQGGGHVLLLESFSEPLLQVGNLAAGDGVWNYFDAVVCVVGGSLEPTFRLPR